MQTNFKTAVVWSQENCSYCKSAKDLLNKYGFDVEERKIGDGERYTKKDLLEAVPHARSVPQIFVGNKYIGGFNELRRLFTDKG